MPLPTIAGVTRVVIRGAMPSGRTWANIWHWQYAGGASTPGPTEFNNLDAIFIRLYSGAAYSGGIAWLPDARNSVTVVETAYTNLDGSSLSYSLPKALTGGNSSGNSLPSEVAHVMTLRTPYRGRRYRGRIYLPPLVTTQ